MAAWRHNVRLDPLCGTSFNEKNTTFSTRGLTYEPISILAVTRETRLQWKCNLLPSRVRAFQQVILLDFLSLFNCY